MIYPSATRRSRRSRAESDFLTFDEVALFSDALVTVGTPGRATALPGHAEPLAARSAERLRLLRLQTAWRRVVGPHLKTVSRPCSYKTSVLTVEVRDVSWRRELERARPEILSRLARLLPDHPVAQISFRLGAAGSQPRGQEMGRTGVPVGHSTAPRLPAAPTDLAVEVSPTLETIADTSLRDHLRGVMGRYLARNC
ncbi:MAG TPA: DUF721 domain-containing protein [Candidatus Polarisedimenticolia bacterium]|jgi:hypothetical protein